MMENGTLLSKAKKANSGKWHTLEIAVKGKCSWIFTDLFIPSLTLYGSVLHGCYFTQLLFTESTDTIIKHDWATMRPGCVSACIDHVTYMERQMDEQMGEMTK